MPHSLLLLLNGRNGSVPTPLSILNGEHFGAGAPASFQDAVGNTLTKTGSVTYSVSTTMLGAGRGYIDINNTGQSINWSAPLTTEFRNYAVFTVFRQTGAVAGGNVLDFRDGTNYKLILPAFNTNVNRNGWYYGQAGSLSDLTDIVGEDTGLFKVRLHLFQGNTAKLFIGGGAVAKSGVFEPTALNTTLRIGLTSSISLDVEVAQVRIYSLPLTKNFEKPFLDEVGAEIDAYYAGATTPAFRPTWSPITL